MASGAEFAEEAGIASVTLAAFASTRCRRSGAVISRPEGRGARPLPDHDR
jgi:hypothetical protein